MSEVRILPQQDSRVESGPIQFGDDWPGTFLRGDCSFFYASALESLLTNPDDAISRAVVDGLLRTLRECDLTRKPIPYTLTDLGNAYRRAMTNKLNGEVKAGEE